MSKSAPTSPLKIEPEVELWEAFLLLSREGAEAEERAKALGEPQRVELTPAAAKLLATAYFELRSDAHALVLALAGHRLPPAAANAKLALMPHLSRLARRIR